MGGTIPSADQESLSIPGHVCKSAEDMAHDIKQTSANAILEEFAVVRDKLGGDLDIWDGAYFVETIG